jgi:hypothetical protein
MADYRPLAEFTMRDLGEMKRRGISTAGSWTGRNLDEAIAMMVRDYGGRLERGRARSVPPALLFARRCSFGGNEKRVPEWARKEAAP